MHSWQYEALFVAVVLSAVAIISGGKATDWTGAAAVLFTFLHGQVSFDFQESQEDLPKPFVTCYKWSGRYFVAKETLWLVTFFLLRSWPLLAGTIIFALYPQWRRWFRRKKKEMSAAHSR